VRDVSTLWRDTALAGTQVIVETVEVLDERDQPMGPALDVLSGSITEDATSTVRLDFSLTVSDPDSTLSASGVQNSLVPFDKRIRIRRGFQYDDGSTETTNLALGWLSFAEIDTDAKIASLGGFDRAAFLQQESVRPVQVPAGRSAELAIRDLLWSVDPSLGWDLMATDWTLPRLTYEAETDLLAEAVKLAESIGAQLAMTRDDRMRLRPIPTATPPAVCRFEEGVNATVLSGSRRWEFDQVHNGVIVIGQHSSLPAPIRAEAWIEDPTSFLYRYGSYKERPLRIRTEKVSTYGQALVMAKGALEKESGGAETIDIEVIPDASVECDDVAQVVLPSLGIDSLMVVQRLSLPLGDPSGTMGLTLRTGVVQ
jgi:hypothetical protein